MPPKGKAPKNTKRFEKAVKAIVRDEIDEAQEDKVAYQEYLQTRLDRNIPFGSVANGQNVFKILPPIVQGDGKFNERVGANLRLKEIDIRGFLHYFPNFATDTLPADKKLAVRVMILKCKEYGAVDKAFANLPTNQLLIGGSADVKPFDAEGANNAGTGPMDPFRHINRNVFSVRYDKVHYMNAPFYDPELTLVNTTSQPSTLKMWSHKMTFGKQGLKLRYANDTDSEANNFPYFLAIGYASLSNAAITPSNDIVHSTFTCRAKYEDA